MYKSFSKTVKEFENQKFNDWVQGASLFVDNMMKKNILKVQFTQEGRKFQIWLRIFKLIGLNQTFYNSMFKDW